MSEMLAWRPCLLVTLSACANVFGLDTVSLPSDAPARVPRTPFGVPVEVTELTSTGSLSDDPSLRDDQLELYFNSNRTGSVGDNDIWGTGTVLLVEDEPMVRTVAERALTRHGYSVVTANNGQEALEILDRGDEFALLISDVVMPEMDGPTMVREARKSRPDLPVLFMSGYAEEQLRKSIDIDKVAFLPKPFSVQELAEAARKALTPV
jgi:CheY-like chemotaxis protein